MSQETKPIVDYSIFEQLDIRLGKITAIEPGDGTPKQTYKLTIDFGKFGTRISYGRFTRHSVEELLGKQIMAVLNFGDKQMGDVTSQCLVLGVQYPKADSGEATIITPLVEAKLGSKLF